MVSKKKTFDLAHAIFSITQNHSHTHKAHPWKWMCVILRVEKTWEIILTSKSSQHALWLKHLGVKGLPQERSEVTPVCLWESESTSLCGCKKQIPPGACTCACACVLQEGESGGLYFKGTQVFLLVKQQTKMNKKSERVNLFIYLFINVFILSLSPLPGY